MPAVVLDRVLPVATGKEIRVGAVAADQPVDAEAARQRVVAIEGGDGIVAIGLPAGKQPRLDVGNRPRRAVVEADLFDLILGALLQRVQERQTVLCAGKTDDEAVGRNRRALEDDLGWEIAGDAHDIGIVPAVVLDRILPVATGKGIGVTAIGADKRIVAEAATERIVDIEGDDTIARRRLPASKQAGLDICDRPGGAVIETDLLDLVLGALFQRLSDCQAVVGAGETDDEAVG
ncbi:hypothetical protein FQZ97_784190 [compost metagenome]